MSQIENNVKDVTSLNGKNLKKRKITEVLIMPGVAILVTINQENPETIIMEEKENLKLNKCGPALVVSIISPAEEVANNVIKINHLNSK